MLITSRGQVLAWRRLYPRYRRVLVIGLGNMQFGAIVGVGEGAMITGPIITVIEDVAAVVAMVIVMVVAVDEAAVPRAGKEGTLPTGQTNMARMNPNHRHPRRSSHRRWDKARRSMSQPTPSILAPAIRRTTRHTPHNCSNLALHNPIRRSHNHSCRRKFNHISIHDSRNSLD